MTDKLITAFFIAIGFFIGYKMVLLAAIVIVAFLWLYTFLLDDMAAIVVFAIAMFVTVGVLIGEAVYVLQFHSPAFSPLFR